VRFTSPSLGGHRQTQLLQHQWELGLSFRQLYADRWFILDTLTPADGSRAVGGAPHRFSVQSLDLSVAYGVSDRVSLRLTVPTATGTNSSVNPDGIRHQTHASGIGDINLVATFALWNPRFVTSGNLALSLGVKAPTGDNSVKGDFGMPDGSVVQSPVHPGIQLGDGGWGIIVQADGYAHLVGALSGYLFGSYQLSPRDTTDVLFIPLSASHMSVPDAYHWRAGVAYALPRWNASVSLGLRTDGVPVHDLIGGSHGWRFTARTILIDPGVSLRLGRGDLMLSMPVRIHGEFFRGPPLPPPDEPLDAGDLAKVLVFAGYAVRL
jgi:hypothetical protein